MHAISLYCFNILRISLFQIGDPAVQANTRVRHVCLSVTEHATRPPPSYRYDAARGHHYNDGINSKAGRGSAVSRMSPHERRQVMESGGRADMEIGVSGRTDGLAETLRDAPMLSVTAERSRDEKSPLIGCFSHSVPTHGPHS